MVDLVEGEGATPLWAIYAWPILQRWGRDHLLGEDLCMVEFAEVGEGSMHGRMADFAEVGEGPLPWEDPCMVDFAEVGEGSMHGRCC